MSTKRRFQSRLLVGRAVGGSLGTVVDLDALADALRSGHLNSAAVDVFPLEPTRPGERFQSSLQGLPNVILTPHIGGSTVEAQARIGEEVTIKLIDYSDAGSTAGAVSFPQVQLPRRAAATRYIHIHRNEPGVLAVARAPDCHIESRGIPVRGNS